jgi:hypothetical protein
MGALWVRAAAPLVSAMIDPEYFDFQTKPGASNA